jgi:hypothetical protein
MKILVSLAAVGFVLLAPRTQAIDFTARFADLVEDGVPMRRMYFTDDAQRIYYRPAPNWSQSCNAQAATFKPKDSERAVVRIENAPLGDARIPLDEHGLQTLRTTAGKLMPPDASEGIEISETLNPVALQGWTSFEIAFDYIRFGQHFSRSILFINLGADRQIHFMVDASPAEFESLHQTAYRTLASWSQVAAAVAP